MAGAGVNVVAGEHRAIADAVESFANDVSGRTDMGKSGLRWVTDNATWTSRAKSYSDIFARVTGKI